MADAARALGSERLSYYGPQSRQRSIAADQEHEVELPIPWLVAAAMKHVETAVQETN
ncbi:MAG: hypothetical protein JO266_19320 [Acidobacteria bacterium]|nr:hypothetical protein [Acidobacteriota bacterium]